MLGLRRGNEGGLRDVFETMEGLAKGRHGPFSRKGPCLTRGMLALCDWIYLVIGQAVIFVDRSNESCGGEDNTQRQMFSSERQFRVRLGKSKRMQRKKNSVETGV